jgi:8-hydroxy-5-deazaflavin:NADPH oxidoreductase
MKGVDVRARLFLGHSGEHFLAIALNQVDRVANAFKKRNDSAGFNLSFCLFATTTTNGKLGKCFADFQNGRESLATKGINGTAYLSWGSYVKLNELRKMEGRSVMTSRNRCIAAIVALFLVFATLPDAVFGQATSSASAIKIGIIGSGNLGGTLGMLWVKSGHPVLFSSRNPDQLKKLVDGLGPLARAGTVREALAFGDVILIAVPYAAYPQIGKDYAQELKGKIVMDAGNAVPARDGEIAKEAHQNGIGVTSAKYLAGARIVRAFNTLNYRRLPIISNRPEGRIGIPIAGDDQEALTVASSLVRDAGFDPVTIGSLERAKDFAQGAPLYGQEITAQEMQRRAKTLQ